jgi:hypothetical protein
MRCAGSERKLGLPVRTGGVRNPAIDDRGSVAETRKSFAARQRQSRKHACRKFSHPPAISPKRVSSMQLM